jgi:hypothetical protein
MDLLRMALGFVSPIGLVFGFVRFVSPLSFVLKGLLVVRFVRFVLKGLLVVRFVRFVHLVKGLTVFLFLKPSI